MPIQGADIFFSALQQRVEILDQSQLQNPRSVSLLISSTKRYLAKPEYRIQLDDLVSQECGHLIAELNEDSFPLNGPWNQDVYLKRVQQYEDLAEPLAKMAGIMGRWGDGSDLSLMLDLLETLYKKAEGTRSGLTVYLDIRTYPAVLAFTAYGLGLTRSQRWATLHELFCALWTTDRRDPQRLVSLLFLQGWKGDNKELWQLLEGLKNRKTPLSDHLLEVMSAWGSSFTGVSTDIAYTFDKFEALASLSYFEQNDASSLEQSAQSNDPRIFASMPMGRLGWHESSYSRITHELKNSAIAGPLLNAGFANGNPRILELFILNLERFHSRMSW
ncbi:hypothetical protein [Halopseudomonas laoshanensis]|uniref:hypothetical protein n=1 Tax=Halopseudomonas laoshanensis TaxID=2268758 RepID=UPI003736A3E2